MTQVNNSTSFWEYSFTLKRAIGWWAIVVLLGMLGAHFYRGFEYGLAVCCAGVLILHCGQALWKQYAVSFFLGWGAFEWAATAFFLANSRMEAGLPWLRASFILLIVALITSFGAIALYKCSEAKEEQIKRRERAKGCVFIILFCLLYYMAANSPLPLLLLQRFTPLLGSAQVFFCAIYGVFIWTTLTDSQRSRKSRKYIWFFFSVVFFGQFLLGILGIERMLMTGSLHIPVPAFIVFGAAFKGLGSVMPILVFVATLLTGSAWCSMLCYFGSFDLLASGNSPVKPLSSFWQWMMRYGRICTLVTGIFVAAALRIAGSSLSVALSLSFIFILVGLLIILVFSRKYASMLHCTAFCPMGLVINVLAKISPWRMAVDTAKCDHCGVCEKMCKYRAITTESRQTGEALFHCSLCLDCVHVCKKQAVSVRCKGVTSPIASSTMQSIFVGIVVILHVIFLSFARV